MSKFATVQSDRQPWLLSDYDYQLPIDCIATEPASVRSDSRLLCLRSTDHTIQHERFNKLIDYLKPGDLLVLNDTKVLPVRLQGYKVSGGRVDIFVGQVLSDTCALVHIRANKPVAIGSVLHVATDTLIVKEKIDHRFMVELQATIPWNKWLAQYGNMPLPPYMKRAPSEADRARYQTVYAKQSGSIAAPTAGLHMDVDMLKQLRAKGIVPVFVTLHIGYGTFEPVRTHDIRRHELHYEFVHISQSACDLINRAKQARHRVVAVGTTVVRALEAAWQNGRLQPLQDLVNLFIYPGYQFNVIDGLVTNFHLPKSSLLMLVCAFAGHPWIMSTYQLAIEHGYKFYSYGDAMYIDNT